MIKAIAFTCIRSETRNGRGLFMKGRSAFASQGVRYETLSRPNTIWEGNTFPLTNLANAGIPDTAGGGGFACENAEPR